jgi:membrane protease YdiL (CAAX protease family)
MDKNINKRGILFQVIAFILASVLILLASYFIDNQLYMCYVFLLLIIIFHFIRLLIKKKYKIKIPCSNTNGGFKIMRKTIFYSSVFSIFSPSSES